MTDVIFTIDGPIARVHLSRPAALNAINRSMEEELRNAWRMINQDPAIRVAILSAEGGRAFCVGADLKALGDSRERIAFGGGLTGIGGPLLLLEKPLVAVVQGYVLGGGFELAMCADIIVAADTTFFGLPETTVGVIAECGVVHRAIRQLPHRVALGMILAGVRLSAQEALQHGLVNEVTGYDQLGPACDRWVARLLRASPLAVQAAKQAALSMLDYPLDVALATKFEKIESYAASEDGKESREAFAARRPPQWKGC